MVEHLLQHRTLARSRENILKVLNQSGAKRIANDRQRRDARAQSDSGR